MKAKTRATIIASWENWPKKESAYPKMEIDNEMNYKSCTHTINFPNKLQKTTKKLEIDHKCTDTHGYCY